jgi:Rap1a immunity proteins
MAGDMQDKSTKGAFELGAQGTLRIIFVVSVSLVYCLFAGEPAAAMTPKALLRSCETVVAGARVRRAAELEVPRTGLQCWYFMSAVQSMSVLIDQNGKPLLGVCVPESTTLLDYVQIFVRYARRLRINRLENAAALVVEALNSTFPCEGRETAGSAASGLAHSANRSI